MTEFNKPVFCESCADNGENRLAVVRVPSSPDKGLTVTYSFVCAAHGNAWWDGADWDGRHLHAPISAEDCTCDARSWHGPEHDTLCPLAGIAR